MRINSTEKFELLLLKAKLRMFVDVDKLYLLIVKSLQSKLVYWPCAIIKRWQKYKHERHGMISTVWWQKYSYIWYKWRDSLPNLPPGKFTPHPLSSVTDVTTATLLSGQNILFFLQSNLSVMLSHIESR